MKNYFIVVRALFCIIPEVIYGNTSSAQVTEQHIYYPLVFQLNDSEIWQPSLKSTTACKGAVIKINIKFAPLQSGSVQNIYLSDQHFSNLQDCRDWNCGITKLAEPLIEGDGIFIKEIVPGNCGDFPDSRITLFAKPEASTTIRVSWTATFLKDAIPAASCPNGAPAIKTTYHYSDSLKIEIKDPQPPVLFPASVSVNQGTSPVPISASFPTDNWNLYLNWYEKKCNNEEMVVQSPVNYPGQSSSSFQFYPTNLGKAEVNAKLSQMDATCISDFSKPSIITVKPCNLFSSGCNQQTVNIIEANSCAMEVRQRSDYHFYKLEKEICSNCDIENVWKKYKSDITNQAVILSDQTTVLGRILPNGVNIGLSKFLFPKENYNTEVTDCATTYLPRITTFMITIGYFTPFWQAAVGGQIFQNTCSKKGWSFKDPIFIRVDEGSKCAVNYTQPGHILYPGKVTRCLVKDCDKVKLLTFGEGTTEFQDNSCGVILSWFNKKWGSSMFTNVDERFASSSINQRIVSKTTQAIANSSKNLSDQVIINEDLPKKNWKIKTFKVKYIDNDSLYEFYSYHDTTNFFNFRAIKVTFHDDGKYSGTDANGEITEGEWSYDLTNKKLITDTSALDLMSEQANEFTIKGRIPILKDTSFSSAEYFMTFFSSPTSSIWIGVADSSWENPDNWSTGILPDEFTDVIINSGTRYNPIIGSNTTVKSLTLQSASMLKIKDGFKLHITGSENDR